MIPPILTKPLVIQQPTRGCVIDMKRQVTTLTDQGCIYIESPPNNRSSRIELTRLHIQDDRKDKSTPAISLYQLNASVLRDVSVNGASVAIHVNNCWDCVLDIVTTTNGVTGVEIVNNCNNIVCRTLRIEQMTGPSLMCRNSRNIVVDRTSKIHGRPTDTTKRTMAVFGNTGSIDFDGRMMHVNPDTKDGLILVYGQKSEAAIITPVVYRAIDQDDYGAALVMRNVPSNFKSHVDITEFLEQSMVDPK